MKKNNFKQAIVATILFIAGSIASAEHSQTISNQVIQTLSKQFTYSKKSKSIKQLELEIITHTSNLIPYTSTKPTLNKPNHTYRQFTFKPNTYPNIAYTHQHTQLPNSSWHGDMIWLFGNWELFVDRQSLTLPDIFLQKIEISPPPSQWSKSIQTFQFRAQMRRVGITDFYQIEEQCTLYPAVQAQFLHHNIQGNARKLICQQQQSHQNTPISTNELIVYTAYFLEDYQFIVPFSQTVYQVDGSAITSNTNILIFE